MDLDDRHPLIKRNPGARFRIALALGMVLLAIAVVGIALALHDGQVSDCRTMGAERVGTGQGNFVCISPDGRVVGP